MSHSDLPPSTWITRFGALLHTLHTGDSPKQALDLACGAGRHVRWLVAQGYRVTAIDRDALALASLADLGEAVQPIVADIESGPWPLDGRTFDVVVVTNYLWRPLLPLIVEAVTVSGVLLYETFAQGQETIGKPARPEFLLAPGELLRVCMGLRVVAYEDGFLPERQRFVQRIAAVRETGRAPALYPLY